MKKKALVKNAPKVSKTPAIKGNFMKSMPMSSIAPKKAKSPKY